MSIGYWQSSGFVFILDFASSLQPGGNVTGPIFNNQHPVAHISEAQTRYKLIAPELVKAGWNLADHSQVRLEVPAEEYDASPQTGITDYCFYRTNGEVLAVIEAKKTKRDARVGKEQVLQYVTRIQKKQSFGSLAFMVGSLTDFLKHVLKLESLPSYEQIVRKAFDTFILEHNYNADQARFLRTVQTVFLQKRKLEEADLYEAPCTNFGANTLEKFFSRPAIEQLLEIARKLTIQ